MTLLRRFFLILSTVLIASCGFPPQRPVDAPVGKSASQPVTTSAGRHVAADTSRTIDLTHPPADAWERIRRGFAIPNLDTNLTRQWTKYYAAQPKSLERMAERAGKYLYYVIDEINRRGLPTELALLPFIESAYDPSAYSPSHAAGLWQFIPSTGRHFNLKQDSWRDERRDPIASTHAALDYLSYLFDFQGDWHLALASYNWGEGAVRRAVAKNRTDGLPTDYLSLRLPNETRHYLPKLQAIKNIVADPAKYAVALPPVENTPYFEIVPKTRSIDVALAAQFAQMSVEEFRALNPAFIRPVILAEHAPNLLLPRDRIGDFKANLQAHRGQLASWKVYRAKRGESLAAIARRHGISEAELRAANNIPRKQRTASELIVPAKATTTTANGARTHTVRVGDTLYDLAKRYGTTVQDLRALNNLADNKLNIGVKLRVSGANVRS